jgi:hypothetical protein
VVVGVLIGALMRLGVGGGGCGEAGDQVFGRCGSRRWVVASAGLAGGVERRGRRWRCVVWFVCGVAGLMCLCSLIWLG